jgi:hypothetical protein
MKIVYGYPPNYGDIASAFNIESNEGVIFTYGDELYIPGGKKIVLDKPLLKHEEVHARQQNAMGIEDWWGRFLHEPDFRLSQELEAYREQYKHMAGLAPEKRAGYLNHIATDLSGDIYGNMITYDQAVAIITEGITLNGSSSNKNKVNRKSKKLQRQNRKKGRR